MKKWINEKWYVQGFNACNILIAQGPRSALFSTHKAVGYGYTKNLFIFNKDYLEYHYLVKDLNRIGKIFLEKQKKDPGYFDWMIKKSEKYEKELENYSKNFPDIKKLDKKEIVKLFWEIFRIDWEHMGYSHILEGIAYVIEPFFEKQLKESLAIYKLDSRFKEYLAILTMPIKPSQLNKENIDFIELCESIDKQDRDIIINSTQDAFKKISKDIRDKIKKHTKEYFWIQINYYIADALTEIDFLEKIRQFLISKPDFSNLLKKENEEYKKNTLERRKILNDLNNKTLIQILDIIDTNMYWQDDRKRFMLKCVYYINLLVRELAIRYDIPFEYAKQLVPEEIDKKIDINELKKRTEKCVCFFSKGRKDMITKIIVGKEAENFIKEFRKKEEKIDDIRGNCASTGKAIGRVRICRTIADIREFKQGEVLVAPMTRPEYMSAMKKAAAIVTDEGGITSHAAIVSRELGIPCIIATKNGTKILRNGQLVEVNANHGWVKIIKE